MANAVQTIDAAHAIIAPHHWLWEAQWDKKPVVWEGPQMYSLLSIEFKKVIFDECRYDFSWGLLQYMKFPRNSF